MGVIPECDSGILNRLVKECRDPKEKERLRALCILSIGYSVSDVSGLFLSMQKYTALKWSARGRVRQEVYQGDGRKAG